MHGHFLVVLWISLLQRTNVVQCQCLLVSLDYCLLFIGPHFKFFKFQFQFQFQISAGYSRCQHNINLIVFLVCFDWPTGQPRIVTRAFEMIIKWPLFSVHVSNNRVETGF